MKAVVFHGLGDIRLEDVPAPQIKEPTDAIVRLTSSAICGTDLHFVRGTFSGVKPGRVLGHEGVGVVESIGPMVRNVAVGERVIIPSTIGCGYCSYCREGYFAQCDNANPGGKRAGTAFFGGPDAAGGYDGLQAEKARVPWANVNLVRIPDEITDDQAILMSDIFPTGWFGADLADIEEGHTVAVFGCGPVGQFAIASAAAMGAGPGHRRRPRRRQARHGAPPRGGSDQLRARGSGPDDPRPHRRRRRGPGDRRGRRRRAARPRGAWLEPQFQPSRRGGPEVGGAPGEHARASSGSPATRRRRRSNGRSKRCARRASSRSSASTRRPTGSFRSARR